MNGGNAKHGGFKLTYGTMFDPPPELHGKFEGALARARARLGAEHAMIIDGAEVRSQKKFERRSPIDRDWTIGVFQDAGEEAVGQAVAAARRAFPAWAGLPWRERVKLLRKAAQLVEERVFDIAAAVALEVGKNRMEAIGEVQESADLMLWYCDQMEEHNGFDRALPNDPLKGYISRNRSVLKPWGVWAVISPFNFPVALTAGPIGAALTAGNTVVFKPASDTPWGVRLFAEALRDAGLPAGSFNYVTGAGAGAGAALVAHPSIAGITFTGSHEVGMELQRAFALGTHARPCIAEMGGKNAAIVSRNGDIERAALGIMRSAFGLQGQKCSACSRVFVERPAAEALRARLVELTAAIRVGDPTAKENWMGPVANERACERYERICAELRNAGRILCGGERLGGKALEAGLYCAPTLAELPFDHALWRQELFLPIALVGEVDSLDEAIRRANDVDYGLTAGFYGNREETQQFLQRIEAGVTYVNRPQGATTGAWPGFQPFGGWKASGSTGKAAGSFYYLPQYLREQSQTIVE
ncbi:MAG: 1-pyrroline-5-carboxylate dehydrogenase [Betaproteobacteria bacterium CG2_30_68_42]|nr:MAG: 1-pyrroline-5-carboxylate dehydrogenase [Betaproteobacteria bacterium CG2_30_68_42]PIX75885.1 MAG: 1-pyrroline-5-carboxylate dehydrogenase [Rhodocyclales bacterium CG_4_10_14_3_um_filter_68_10]PJA58626.1 MAG: 1-pyrroline-5-carboxylate dehydrogenase [Rhodocyclales bacterium CG_4_9_14_3_um_filter_68_10]